MTVRCDYVQGSVQIFISNFLPVCISVSSLEAAIKTIYAALATLFAQETTAHCGQAALSISTMNPPNSVFCLPSSQTTSILLFLDDHLLWGCLLVHHTSLRWSVTLLILRLSISIQRCQKMAAITTFSSSDDELTIAVGIEDHPADNHPVGNNPVRP